MKKWRLASAILGLVASTGAGMVMPTTVLAEGEGCFSYGGENYSDFKEVRDIAEDGGVITLTCDAVETRYFGIGKNLTLDLNDHNYTTSGYGAFQVQGGKTLTVRDSAGNGVLTGARTAVSLVDGSKLVQEGGELSAADWGVIAFKDTEFVMNGGKVRCTNEEDGCYGVSGNGSLSGSNDGRNAKITINSGEIISTELGVYAPQAGGVTTLGAGAVINAKVAGVEVRAGRLIVDGATIIVDEEAPYEFNPNGNGATAKGVAIAVAQHTTTQPIDVEIRNGYFEAPVVFAESNPQNNGAEDVQKVSVAITGGAFHASSAPIVVSEDVAKFITGGIYNKPFAEGSSFVADGYAVARNENAEIYEVINPETFVEETGGTVDLGYDEEKGGYVILAPETDLSDITDGIVSNGEVSGVVWGSLTFNKEFVADRRAFATIQEKASEGLVLDTTNVDYETALVAVFDVSLQDRHGVKVDVAGSNLTVRLNLTEAQYAALKAYNGVKVVYFDDNGIEQERLDAEISELEEIDGSKTYILAFNTTHLSTYGVVGVNETSDEGKGSAGTPETGVFTVNNGSSMAGGMMIAAAVAGLIVAGTVWFAGYRVYHHYDVRRFK